MTSIMTRTGIAVLVLIALLTGGGTALADESGDRIAALEKEVQALREEVQAALDDGAGEGADDARLAELERQIGLLAEEIEKLRLGDTAAVADQGEHGLGPAASKIYRTKKGVSIGGYGEVLYQAFDSQRDDGEDSAKTDTADFLRAVLYVGYRFSHRWVLNTELEFEHASTGESGSVSVEFAYLDYLWRPAAGFRGGLVLLPMGFLNELHEPTVFLGAQRPQHRPALERHAFGHRQGHFIAPDSGHEGQPNARIATGRLDDLPTGRQLTVPLGGLDHGQADAILDAAQGIISLHLGQNLAAAGVQAIDAHQGGSAHHFGGTSVNVLAHDSFLRKCGSGPPGWRL